MGKAERRSMGQARHALDAARRVEGPGGGDCFQGWRHREEIRVSRKPRQKSGKALLGAGFGKAAGHAKRQVKPKRGWADFRDQARRQGGGVAHQARGGGVPMLGLAPGQRDPALAGIQAPIRMGGDHVVKFLARSRGFVSC